MVLPSRSNTRAAPGAEASVQPCSSHYTRGIGKKTFFKESHHLKAFSLLFTAHTGCATSGLTHMKSPHAFEPEQIQSLHLFLMGKRRTRRGSWKLPRAGGIPSHPAACRKPRSCCFPPSPAAGVGISRQVLHAGPGSNLQGCNDRDNSHRVTQQ